MSRLTGSDVKSMMEAYNAVYAPQELTEEQVWEEVENWVNSLLEEGYDLSEYTWEEMYESYLNEGYVPWDFGPRDKAKAKHTELAARKAAGGSAPGTATRANKIASVGREMRTTLDKDSAVTMTNPKKQGLQPSTSRHTAAALRGAGGGGTARTQFDVKPLKPASKGPKGGGSTAQNVGSPSGTRGYQVGGGQGYGISGIKLADEFDSWVNSLVEEGYDLSEYTWEEMYESYIEEQGGRRGSTTPKGSSVTSTGVAGLSAADRAAYSAGGGNAAAQRGMGSTTAQVIAQGKKNLSRFDTKTPEQKSDDSKAKLDKIVRDPNFKPNNLRAGTESPEKWNKPAAPKPAAPKPAALKPAAPKPAATPNPTPTSAATSATPAPKKPSLSSQADDLRAMRQRSQERQGVKAESFDLFDIVISHLLDEGYADTNEAALVIMANMSEEWRQSIIEDFPKVLNNYGTQGPNRSGDAGTR